MCASEQAAKSRDELLFELRNGEYTWRLYESGYVEGFPEGTVILNKARPLLATLRCLAGKKDVPAAHVTGQKAETSY